MYYTIGSALFYYHGLHDSHTTVMEIDHGPSIGTIPQALFTQNKLGLGRIAKKNDEAVDSLLSSTVIALFSGYSGGRVLFRENHVRNTFE